MNPELMALMRYVLPFMRQQQTPSTGFVDPGAGGAPNRADLATALGQNPALAGITPDMVTGVGPRAPTPPSPEFGMALGRMGQGLIGREGGGDNSGGRPERFVHGAPQGMPAKVGNPQTDFQMAGMQNPVSSVGQFLLSPQGQQIIQALKGMGA